ncbi:ArsR family transcriptional regulator, partial [Candidatus Woesearchaeota archaeon]|nr:ArsR family transcriptional regulator [Candidatus Woesearchaeota archaeon]
MPRITIVRTRKPKNSDINDDLIWFCRSLGLFGVRDKDKSCFRLFVTLLKALKSGRDMTSDEIADNVNLSRGTVIHHMRKLIGSGLVVSRNNKYGLKYDNLSDILEEMEHELLRTMDKLKRTAEVIDDRLSL